MTKKAYDGHELVAFVIISLAVGIFIGYALAPNAHLGYGTMGPGMMWGGGGYGMMGYMQDYRNTVDADCSTVTTEELIEIGDELMGQMIGNEAVHERIDETYPNIDAIHLMIGRMATGCY